MKDDFGGFSGCLFLIWWNYSKLSVLQGSLYGWGFVLMWFLVLIGVRSEFE